jgi:K+-transporting ATPase ATPase A chain
MTDEVIFGGIGSGMFMMVGFILLTVFIAGLMVGRTPEYLGKKLGAREVKAVATILLVLASLILFGSGLAAVMESGTIGLGNSGPHGLSEILYAFSSAAGNNGSAFGGLTANTDFYNTALGVTIIFGRYVIVIGMLVVAGTLVTKKRVAPSLGTFPTDGKLFASFLVGVVVIVGLLTFFPALALGPIVEQLLVRAGQLF